MCNLLLFTIPSMVLSFARAALSKSLDQMTGTANTKEFVVKHLSTFRRWGAAAAVMFGLAATAGLNVLTLLRGDQPTANLVALFIASFSFTAMFPFCWHVANGSQGEVFHLRRIPFWFSSMVTPFAVAVVVLRFWPC
jgi:hypothetical protein